MPSSSHFLPLLVVPPQVPGKMQPHLPHRAPGYNFLLWFPAVFPLNPQGYDPKGQRLQLWTLPGAPPLESPELEVTLVFQLYTKQLSSTISVCLPSSAAPKLTVAQVHHRAMNMGFGCPPLRISSTSDISKHLCPRTPPPYLETPPALIKDRKKNLLARPTSQI